MGACSDALYYALVSDLRIGEYPTLPGPDSGWCYFAKYHLQQNIFKKLRTSVADDADAKALRLFLECNENCRLWEERPESSKDEVLIGEFKRAISNFWFASGEPLVHSFHELFHHGRCGPGSSREGLSPDSYTKLFASSLTSTSETLYAMYRQYSDRFPDWRVAEDLRCSKYGKSKILKGNRLTFVPKSNVISRTICVEPTLNMFIQLGLGHILESRLRSVFNIDLSKQPDFNRELARVGSVNGEMSTIDLSSASDTISLKMLESCLPKSFIQWLRLCRSAEVEVGNASHTLHMISSMGNGFTFPLQTIIFACVVSACYAFRGFAMARNHGITPGNFAVFGDDIVCHSSCYGDICRLLTLLGFSVNMQKSFSIGPFRESCGHDYISGRNVRPVFIKGFSTKQERCVAINRLNDWTSRTGIPLPLTIAVLNGRDLLKVPICENDDAGVRMPLSLIEKRFIDKRTKSLRYRRYSTKIRAAIVHDGYVLYPPGVKVDHFWNPSGLHLMFLAGYVRNSRIGIRLDIGIYSTKWAITPYWDYDPTNPPFEGWARAYGMRWACLINMS